MSPPISRPRRLSARARAARAALEEERKALAEKKKRFRRIKWLGAGIVTAVLIYSLSWQPPNRRVPYELVGRWQTTDEKYADRWFDIDAVLIDFGTGAGTASTGFIKEVTITSEPNRTLYTILYRGEGTMNQVSLYYEPSDGGTIRLQHQESTIWKKQ